AFLEQNVEFANKIERQIREKLFPGQVLKTKEGVPVEKIAEAKAAVKGTADSESRVELTAKGSSAAKASAKKEIPSELF
ncbi:MAG: recombinase RecA, partial [Treponema sp.]|nr:recombinase RecA [Treponema sp.]